jgi:hypothetical protein
MLVWTLRIISLMIVTDVSVKIVKCNPQYGFAADLIIATRIITFDIWTYTFYALAAPPTPGS